MPDPSVEPTTQVDQAAAALGISRGAAYNAVQTGEIISGGGRSRYLSLSRECDAIDRADADQGDWHAGCFMKISPPNSEGVTSNCKSKSTGPA